MLKNLGERIRSLRKTKGITLMEIARKTGIAQATLSRIETGTMTGTLESHEKIAEVLGIGLSELYEGLDGRYAKTARLTSDEKKKVHFHSSNVQVELLIQESSKKKITPYLISFEGKGQTDVERYDRGVEKFFYQMEGESVVKLENEIYTLKSGDTIYFDGALGHQIINESGKPSRILAAVSPSQL